VRSIDILNIFLPSNIIGMSGWWLYILNSTGRL